MCKANLLLRHTIPVSAVDRGHRAIRKSMNNYKFKSWRGKIKMK